MSILNVSYSWKLFAYYLTIPLHIFGFSGRRISIGFWCRFTEDVLAPTEDIVAPTQESSDDYHDTIYCRHLGLTRANIRLLKLEPGVYKDPLVGNLQEIHIENAEGTYTALSYVWGDRLWDKEIQIDGIRVPINGNLNEALRRVRSKTTVITLWVDAICINQSDSKERGHQVSLMPQIYAQAEAVFSWLGEATQHSMTGVEILSYLAGDHPFNDNSPWNRINAQTVVLGLQDILQRVYFIRVWIVQEAALGRQIKMQVGDISLRWDGANDTWRFLTRIKLLEISPVWQTEPLRGMDLRPIRELLEQSVTTRDKKAGINRPTTLLDLVHTMRHMKSTDPRDKIYALMGLASPADIAGFSPGYDGTWEETYQRFYNHVHLTALQNPSQVWQAGR